MPCSCPLVHKDFRKFSNREPRAPKKSLHYSGSPQRHLPDPVRPAIPCLPALTTSSIVLRMALRNAGHPASQQILPSSYSPTGKSFWKGGARGGRTFFQKGFPPRKLFSLSSNLQASACRPCRTMFPLRGDRLDQLPPGTALLRGAAGIRNRDER